MLTDALDAFEIFRRRHAALDEGDVRVGVRIERAGLGEVHQVDTPGEREQIFAEVEKGELATIAGTELVHRHARFAGCRRIHQNPLCASKVLTSPQLNTGPSRQTNAPPS